jgi:hypothetical protein
MKKEVKILAADHNPVKVGDGVLVNIPTKKRKPTSPGPNSDNDGKKPRKSLDERIAETIVKTVPNLIDNALTKALEPVMSRLDKQVEFNKVVTDYMKSHP